MKQGAIFDQDGLLFDTERLYAQSWDRTAEACGAQPNAAFRNAVCGTSGQRTLDVIHQYYPHVDPEWFRSHCVSLVQQELECHVPEKPGVHEILQYLRENGVKIALASSSARYIVLNNLERTGLRPYFDVVVTGEDIKNGKPKPDIFLTAAQMLGLPPEECYVFEDGFHGVRAGAAAGCFTVMIPDLYQPTEEICALYSAKYASLTDALDALRSKEI